MEHDILKRFKLPNYLKDKTFAEASKKINDKFEGRNDKASVETKKELLSRLASAQEFIKADQAPTTNQMAYGGNTGNMMGMFGMMGNMAGRAMQKNPDETVIAGDPGTNAAVDGTKDMVAQATGPWGQMFRGIQKMGQGLGDTIGGEGGAGVADAFSPEESTIAGLKNSDFNAWEKIGSTVPILGGVLNQRYKKSQTNKEQNKQALMTSNIFDNDFALGGSPDPDPKKYWAHPIRNPNYRPKGGLGDDWWQDTSGGRMISTGNQKPLGTLGTGLEYNMFDVSLPHTPLKTDGYFDMPDYVPPTPTTASQTDAPSVAQKARDPLAKVPTMDIQGPFSSKPVAGDMAGKQYSPDMPVSNTTSGVGEALRKIGQFGKDNYADILRYAPAIANAIQLAKLKKPEAESRDRLANRYSKDLVDVEALRNSIQQNVDNTRRAITNASTGDSGATRSNILAAQLQGDKALSNAILQADNINRGENSRAQEFNMNVDRTNLGQSNLEKEINARNQGIYDTNKSALIAQLGNDVGNIGKEQKYKQMVKEMGLCYDAKGRYICGTDERIPDDVKIEDDTKKAMGGTVNHNTIFTDYLQKILSQKQ